MAPRDQLNNLLTRIQESDDISEPDREVLVDFYDALELLNAEYSDHRKLKLLRHVTIMAEEVGGLAAALDDREAAEELVRWIHANYENEETNRDYRVALRVFGRRVVDDNGDETPDSLEWIPTGTSKNYDTKPDPREMLGWEEDVLPMIDETLNSRDQAAIALQFDAGLRGGEFKDLTVGSITDHKHGLQITVDGKQGQRTVTLIPSVPHIQKWLADHPAPDDPDAPLWSKLERPDAMSYTMISKMFKEPAKRAGVTKPVTLTNFRKSSASYLASRGMSQAHIEEHHGWVRGSDVAARYVTVFAEDASRELAKIHGADVEEEEPEPLAPIECPRCGERTPRDRPLCVWCGQALEPGAAERAEAIDDLLVEEMAAADPSEADELLGLRKEIRSDPEARAEAIDRLSDLS
ncbi:MAG: tyrosine-type recombinase/integrase [Halodesulfurarchaeum sp.]